MDITNLQTLIEAGSLQEATALAESWRLSCVELKATIEQKLADTRRDIYSVDWEGEMKNLLNGAMDRIERSRFVIVAAKDTVNSRFDIIEDLHAQKFGSGRPQQEEYYQLGDLYRVLEACYLAHVELHRPLIGARSVWLDEQVRQSFSFLETESGTEQVASVLNRIGNCST